MKESSRDEKDEPRNQYAALPWRNSGTLKILLISSRESRRWVLPKGWPMKGREPHAAAAREALEEAGIKGKIGKSPLGAYHYYKRRKNGANLRCEVTVFPMQVSEERKNWLEKRERVRRWFDLTEAADAVEEDELRQIILAFAPGESAI